MNANDSLRSNMEEGDVEALMQELHELKMRFRVAKSKLDGFVGVNRPQEELHSKLPDAQQPTPQPAPSSHFPLLEEKRSRLVEVEKELQKEKETSRKQEKEMQECVRMIESVRQEVAHGPHIIKEAKMEGEELLVEKCEMERVVEETRRRAREKEDRLRGLQSLLEESQQDLLCDDHLLQEERLLLQELVERVGALEGRAEWARQVAASPNKRGNSEFVRLEDRSDKYKERLSAIRAKYDRKRAELSRLSHQLSLLREELARLSIESSMSSENPEVASVKRQITELKKKESERLARAAELEADLSLPKICPEDPNNPTSVANTNLACAMVQYQREEWQPSYREMKAMSERRVKEMEHRMELDNRRVDVSLQLHRTTLRVESLSALVLQLEEKMKSVDKEEKRVQFAVTDLTTEYPPADSVALPHTAEHH